MNWDIVIVITVCTGILLVANYLHELRIKRKIAMAKKIARRGIQVGQKYEIQRQRMAYMANAIKEGRIHGI